MHGTGRGWRFVKRSLAALAVAVTCAAGPSHAQDHATPGAESAAVTGESDVIPRVADYLAIAAVVSIACLSAGYAVAKVGSAALGAAAERPEILGRALIFVGLAEGIAIYGLIFGILLLRKL